MISKYKMHSLLSKEFQCIESFAENLMDVFNLQKIVCLVFNKNNSFSFKSNV